MSASQLIIDTILQQLQLIEPGARASHTDLEGFDALAELALDLRWSWNRATDAPWQRLDPVLLKTDSLKEQSELVASRQAGGRVWISWQGSSRIKSLAKLPSQIEGFSGRSGSK